jgi:hypothetical protein
MNSSLIFCPPTLCVHIIVHTFKHILPQEAGKINRFLKTKHAPQKRGYQQGIMPFSPDAAIKNERSSFGLRPQDDNKELRMTARNSGKIKGLPCWDSPRRYEP